MKKIIYICASIWLMVSACQDFLDVRPVGAVDATTLSNEFGIGLALTGMYQTFHGTGDEYYFRINLANYAYGDVMGGSANKGTTFNDQSDFTELELYTFINTNSYLNSKWAGVYNGVFRANNVINLADGIKDELSAIDGESKDFYTETIAQARFFRGLWLFDGIKHFGAAIPYVGSEEFASSVNPKVSNVDESGNYIYIWDKVIEDLQFAYDNLPDTWSTDYGRINKWAAAATLAKVKLFKSSPYNGTNGTSSNWSEVKSLLETVMASGKDSKGTKYRLADTYETLYVAGESDWTGESVLDIQMAISGTQVYTNAITGSANIAVPGALGTSGWGFFQPSYELVNSHIVDTNGLPYLDQTYQDLDPLTKLVNASPVTDLAVYTDPRLDISVGRFNVPYWDWAVPATTDGWVRDVGNGGLYLNKKNMPKKADKGSLSVTTSSSSTAKNFHIMRYAEVLLMYAEVLIETGDLSGARGYINQVRERAANSYVKAADPTTMEETTSTYILDDKVNGVEKGNAAANYRVGLYPESQFATKEGATKALRFERKLELALEGHRWYDLARWGIIHDELTDYLSYEQQYLPKFEKSIYRENWVTLPIPNNQIVTMEGILVQNENWK